jgi:hypothetical protein
MASTGERKKKMSTWPLKMAKAKGKAPFPPESLKKCPCGHVHISWSNGDEYLFCWDCNQRYPLTACFQPHERGFSESEEPIDQP